jgi:alanine racemase
MNTIEKQIQSIVRKYGTGLLINTKNIIKNYEKVKQKSLSAQVSWVVKNNAYELGVKNILPLVEEVSCHELFVATLEEGVEVRDFNKKANIYVLHGLIQGTEEDFINYNLIPVLNTYTQIKIWVDFAKIKNVKLPAIIHVETGINRLAIGEQELQRAFLDLDFRNYLDIKFVMGHFACADKHKHFSHEEQYQRFVAYTKHFPNTKYSLAASYGIFVDEKYHFDLVRPAIALYGSNMTPHKENDMSPVIHLYSHIMQVKDLNIGEHVGYGYTFEVKRKAKIAVIPCGYADGVIRKNSNRGFVCIAGFKAPIVGTVSMDLITIDITDIPEPLQKEGELVEIIGDNIGLDDIAKNGETVHCEIINLLTTRYPRIFI